jgi:hypothetical protein
MLRQHEIEMKNSVSMTFAWGPLTERTDDLIFPITSVVL